MAVLLLLHTVCHLCNASMLVCYAALAPIAFAGQAQVSGLALDIHLCHVCHVMIA